MQREGNQKSIVLLGSKSNTRFEDRTSGYGVHHRYRGTRLRDAAPGLTGYSQHHKPAAVTEGSLLPGSDRCIA